VKTRKYVEVLYEPDLQNWNEVIEQELKRRGFRHGQVTVICRPFKRLKDVTSSKAIFPQNGSNHDNVTDLPEND
jgi:hypothetical protein